MKKITIADILAMPVSERILFVEDVWDSIAATPETVKLTDTQREELDRCLDLYHNNPLGGSPWDEVKAKIRGSK